MPVKTRIDRDAFEEWTAHPITEAMLRAFESEAARLREQWTAMSFDAGACDPLLLLRFRARAELFRELRQAEIIEGILNGEE